MSCSFLSQTFLIFTLHTLPLSLNRAGVIKWGCKTKTQHFSSDDSINQQNSRLRSESIAAALI